MNNLKLNLKTIMASKFYAVNRKTGEKWKPEKGSAQCLMMYDSGRLAVKERDYHTYVTPLNPKEWKVVIKDNFENLKTK